MPKFPAPLDVNPEPCGDSVCLSVEDTLELAQWAAGVDEFYRGVLRCAHVVQR